MPSRGTRSNTVVIKKTRSKSSRPISVKTITNQYLNKRMRSMGGNIRSASLAFPRAKFVKFRYADNYYGTVTGGANNLASVQFKLNSLHDPQGTLTVYANTQGTAGGHQPYYYDQVRPMYDYYCVYKVKLIIRVINGGYTNNIIRDADDNSTLPTNVTLEMERPNNKVGVYNANGDRLTLTKTFDIAKVAGVSRTKLFDDPAYSGGSASSSDPVNLIYANYLAQYVDGGLTGFAGLISVNVIQYARFFGVTQVAQS